MSDATTTTTTAVLGTHEFQALVMAKITAIEAKLDEKPTKAELDIALRSETVARTAAIDEAIKTEQQARADQYKTITTELRTMLAVALNTWDGIAKRIEQGVADVREDVQQLKADEAANLQKFVNVDRLLERSDGRVSSLEIRATTLFSDVKGIHDRVFGDQSKPDDKSLFAIVAALPDQITAGLALRLDTFEQKMQADTNQVVADFVKQMQADMNDVKEWMHSRRQIETAIWGAIKGAVSNKWVQRIVLGLIGGGGLLAAVGAVLGGTK